MESSGDLQFEERTGKYHKRKNLIIFDLKPDYDTLRTWYSELDCKDIDTTTLPPFKPIIYDRNEYIIRKFLIRKNKLIPVSEDGKRHRKEKLIKIDKEKWGNVRGAGIWRESPDSIKK